MRLKEEREAARAAAAEAADAEQRRFRALLLAESEERRAVMGVEAGDVSAMVDVLDSVVVLHDAGCDEEAAALLSRIKSNLSREDADEADAFVSEKLSKKDEPAEPDEPVVEAVTEEAAPTQKKGKKKS